MCLQTGQWLTQNTDKTAVFENLVVDLMVANIRLLALLLHRQ
jgi:hypothetical protein